MWASFIGEHLSVVMLTLNIHVKSNGFNYNLFHVLNLLAQYDYGNLSILYLCVSGGKPICNGHSTDVFTIVYRFKLYKVCC